MVVTVPKFFYVASEWSGEEDVEGREEKAAGKMPKAALMLMLLFNISVVIVFLYNSIFVSSQSTLLLKL